MVKISGNVEVRELGSYAVGCIILIGIEMI